VQFDHLARAGALMETVDILGDDRRAVEALLPVRDRLMPGVRPDLEKMPPPRQVEVPDVLRVASKRLRRRDLLGPTAMPESVSVAKRGNAALGRDPGAGGDRDPRRAQSRSSCSI
jgi:hypothetical protein